MALRLPGIYGVGDNMIIDPIVSDGISSVPSGGSDVRIDFCYVENAAHAHACAVATLLGTAARHPERAAGLSFHITNGEPARPAIETWSELVAEVSFLHATISTAPLQLGQRHVAAQ